MIRNTKGLRDYIKTKTEITIQKVNYTIAELASQGKKINFNSVSIASGVSKTFLYNNQEVKSKIEQLREDKISQRIKEQGTGYNNIIHTKDSFIQLKEKRILELELENKQLRTKLQLLQEKQERCNGQENRKADVTYMF